MRLDDGTTWYVRRDNGRGVYPVRPEGWVAFGLILFSTLISAVAALIIKDTVPEIPWLWLAVFIVVVVGDAVAFFVITRLKTDNTLTVSEYRAREARRS
ncbi:hypothetical protein sos41_26670 [Alphaproteobacteria bacterium SO-S41]|nr:hypothetical protein sos41_26670 [Alphaproteobacteria bacterium SO-S41]